MSTAPYASRTTTLRPPGEPSHPTAAIVAVLLGILVAVLGFFALLMWVDAHNARDDAHKAARQAQTAAAMPGMDMSATARRRPAELRGRRARERRRARRRAQAVPRRAAAGARRPGRRRAPRAQGHHRPDRARRQVRRLGVGRRRTRPVIHVRQGQMVKITLTNDGAIPHSVDFHAARVAPDKAFGDVMPGKSVSYTFRANDPGVFMYHCGTKPVLMHIANGMYGAIVVEPPAGTLPKADKNYVLVASEWYLDSDGLKKPAQFNMDKAHARQPDWMTFNGYSGQYVKHPLTAKPGETVRFWVVDAGPSIDTDFHIVGTVLNRAWVDAGLTNKPLENVQTVAVPAGGGGVFDVKIDKPGLYPFVSHAFAAVDQGQVGLLNVGGVHGTMTH